MYKFVSIFIFLTLMIVGCESESGTEPINVPTHDQALVGIWNLSKSMLNGSDVSYENLSNCCVKYQFITDGTGIVWKKDYGISCGSKSILWSTKNNQLTIHEENEYPLVVNYVVNNETITISFTEQGAVEMTYSKQ